MPKKENSNEIVAFTLADIAKAAELSAVQCYGVVDLYSSENSKHQGNKNPVGAIARKTKNGYEIDLYLILGYAIRMTEVVVEIQKKVKYDLEKKFKVHFNAINIYVQGVKSL